jgi:hypothetical protein
MVKRRPAIAYLTVDHFLVIAIDRYEIAIVKVQIEIKLKPDFLSTYCGGRSGGIETPFPVIT